MLAHPGSIHYTQGKLRWEGINRNLRSARGEYPHHSDCSSSATWVLWNALTANGVAHDIVNGTNWKAGYTGTMLAHGKPVRHRANWRVGDCIIYGRTGSTGAHVVVYLGGNRAFSHGSEGGPYLVDVDYRPDIMAVRRYI